MVPTEVPRPSITPDTMVTHADGVADGEMDGEVVLMSVANGEYYALDPVASRLWKMVAAPRSVGDVCHALHEQYEGPTQDVNDDVLGFVRDLVQRGLLRIEG